MLNTDMLALPFFDTTHASDQAFTEQWCRQHLTNRVHHGDVDDHCRLLVRSMGKAGLLRHTVARAHGGSRDALDSRSLCLQRQTLGRFDGLADFCFAMQGLGSGPISLFGSPEMQAQYLPAVAQGKLIAAFALSEPEAGSDAAAMQTLATRQGDTYVINGTKTWISNAGIADFYTVFAYTENDESDGVSAFVVAADTPGLVVSERFDVCAPHPIGTLTFKDCRLPATNRIGLPGQGFKIALQTLDVFRASVGAAALGFAEAALALSLQQAASRKMFGGTLGDLQLTQAAIGDMSTDIDASTLLVYRAAWERDVQGKRTTRSAAMAKLFATESAQKIVDRCVQLHGGLGVKVGHPAEMLYREIRALRIYEGATEVQQVVIARETIKLLSGVLK